MKIYNKIVSPDFSKHIIESIYETYTFSNDPSVDSDDPEMSDDDKITSLYGGIYYSYNMLNSFYKSHKKGYSFKKQFVNLIENTQKTILKYVIQIIII